MPSGHTDRATINQRRPLTDNMTEFLRTLDNCSRSSTAMNQVLFKGEMTQAEKNAAKGLLHRDLIGWDQGLHAYYINNAGRAALKSACGKELTMAKIGAAIGKYGFTCGYCETLLDTPYDDAERAGQFAQQQGWRMTWGFSTRWGHGANNTCPDCLPLPGSSEEVLPIHDSR